MKTKHRKIKIIYKERPPIVLRIWKCGIENIGKICNFLFSIWYLICCFIFLVSFFIAGIYNIITLFFSITVLCMFYELVRKKWFPRKTTITVENFFDDFKGNWILSSVQILFAAIIFILSLLLALAWTIFLIAILLETFPWCLLLLLMK